MGLAAINSQYNGLNGLSGFGGGFGFGAGPLYSDAYVDNAKTSIANGYEVSATSNSYANKGSVSASSYTQQCQAIEYLLQSGRTDDAMEKFNSLYMDMASNSYYSGYSENEIKTLLQEKYMDATGTTLVNDINAHSASSFSTGFATALPGIGLMFNANSGDKFIAEATGTKESKLAKIQEAAGVTTAVAATGAAAAAGVAIAGAVRGTGSSRMGRIAAAAIAGGAALLTFIGNKASKADKN